VIVETEDEESFPLLQLNMNRKERRRAEILIFILWGIIIFQ
jgi:hypothetical protein